MKIFAFVVAILLLAGTVQAGDRALLGVVIGSNIADLVTTELARASGNGQEANPLLQNQKVFWGIKAGATALQVTVVHSLWTQDHKRAAVVIALAIGGLNSWVSQHNARIAGLR